jgi:hypothetical protein
MSPDEFAFASASLDDNRKLFIVLTGCEIQSLNLWGFCNGLRLFFFGHSQDCFLLACHE